MFLLDTNICIYIMRRHPPQVLQKFEVVDGQSISISVITLAELEYGVAKSQAQVRNRKMLDAFLLNVEVINWDEDAARIYGKVCTDLEQKGTVIGQMDLMIAAHCLSLDRILVTNNVRAFERVPGLRVENWA